MDERQVAEVFPPGDFIREELEARGWTQGDLAEIMGKSARLVNEVIAGKRSITPETAQGLGKAFGTSAQFWMNLDSGYQLSKVRGQGEDVSRRARLYELFPVKDMVRRGWIEPTQSVEVLETRFQRFFEVEDLTERPAFPFAARKAAKANLESPALIAWLFRTRQLAMDLDASSYSREALESAVLDLREWMARAEDIERVPERLALAGVRLVVVEAFPGMKVDGVCYWLDKGSPVVALSLRLDRIDNFWFVLLHELRHVANEDGMVVDENMGAGPVDETEDTRPECERKADSEAAAVILPEGELNAFIQDVFPSISERRILAFAETHRLHPGLVVGQLQHRKAVPYSHHRKHLVKIREQVAGVARTDGWGMVAD